MFCTGDGQEGGSFRGGTSHYRKRCFCYIFTILDKNYIHFVIYSTSYYLLV